MVEVPQQEIVVLASDALVTQEGLADGRIEQEKVRHEYVGCESADEAEHRCIGQLILERQLAFVKEEDVKLLRYVSDQAPEEANYVECRHTRCEHKNHEDDRVHPCVCAHNCKVNTFVE